MLNSYSPEFAPLFILVVLVPQFWTPEQFQIVLESILTTQVYRVYFFPQVKEMHLS